MNDRKRRAVAQFALRRAKATDAANIRMLTRSAYEKWVPLIGREPKPMTADYERAVREHIIDLYKEGNQLLALLEMIPLGDHLLIENIAVCSDQQGKGFGDKLLRHAEDYAKSVSIPRQSRGL